MRLSQELRLNHDFFLGALRTDTLSIAAPGILGQVTQVSQRLEGLSDYCD